MWKEGKPAVAAWLSTGNPYLAEILAHSGVDAVVIDMQHGMVDFQAGVSMLQAISTCDVTPLARVPWNDPTPIMKMLDAGAYGIICPMVNTREECEKFVGACRYAPAGYRSYGPARAIIYGGADYASEANDTVITFAMIETVTAVENLDSIMSVEGLDAVYVGPSDLAISLGNPPSVEPTADNVIAAIAEILQVAHKHGVKAGIHCPSGSSVQDKFQKGFDFGTISADYRLMAAAAEAEIKAARAT